MTQRSVIVECLAELTLCLTRKPNEIQFILENKALSNGIILNQRSLKYKPNTNTTKMFSIAKSYLTTFWKFYVLVLTPFLLIPIVLSGIPEEVSGIFGNIKILFCDLSI